MQQMMLSHHWSYPWMCCFVWSIKKSNTSRKPTHRGTKTVISGTNIPSSVKSRAYRVSITSNDPCLIKPIWSSWCNSENPTKRLSFNQLDTFTLTEHLYTMPFKSLSEAFSAHCWVMWKIMTTCFWNRRAILSSNVQWILYASDSRIIHTRIKTDFNRLKFYPVYTF